MPSEHVYRFVPASGSPSTVVLFHESGGDENDLVPVGRGVAPAAALLSLRGGLEQDGVFQFLRRGQAEAADREEARRQDLERAAAAIETTVRAAAARHGFDPTRLLALGYSDGADMLALTLLLYPTLISGAVLLRASLPYRPEPILPVAQTPVLVIAGQSDQTVPASETEKLAQTLSYAGARVEVRWHNRSHELGPEDFTAARDFFKPFL